MFYWDKKLDNELIISYKESNSDNQAVFKFGCRYNILVGTVYRRLKRLHIKVKRNNRAYKWDWDKLDKELIIMYRGSVEGVTEFSKKYDIPVITIYARLRKLNIKMRTNSEAHKNLQIGEKNSHWKGGKRISNGYVMIYIPDEQEYKAEHILVMEKHLGRKLLPGEIVHHIDETFEGRSKNDISNLQLTNRPDHTTHHMIGNKHAVRREK